MRKRETPKIKLLLLMVLASSLLPLQAQQLPALMKQLEEENPSLRVKELQADEAREAIQETKGLSKTEFGAGYGLSPVETRTGPQQLRLTVRQMLPWFGSRSAKATVAEAKAEVADLGARIQRLQLIRELGMAYYELYGLHARTAILDENLALVRDYEELAFTAVENASASAVDVIRLQLRISELKERLQILKIQVNAQKARLNLLVGRSEDTPIEVPDTLYLPEIHDIEISQLLEHPELELLEQQLRAVKAAGLVNEKDASPNLGVGLDYVLVGERSDANPADNGKDIVMPMVSVGIPLFSSQYKSRAKQIKLQVENTEARQEEALNNLRDRYELARKEALSASHSYNTRQENIAQLKDALQILLVQYEGSQADFTQVLDLQEQLLKYQVQAIDAATTLLQAQAKLDYLRGKVY